MFAVVSQRDGNVYDVSYRKNGLGYRVLLVPLTTGDTQDIGFVMQMTCNLGKPWTAVPSALHPNTMDGFSARRTATEYLVRESGHWKNDRTLTADVLNGSHIGKSLTWFRDSDRTMDLDYITLITHKKNGRVRVRWGTNNREREFERHAVFGEKR